MLADDFTHDVVVFAVTTAATGVVVLLVAPSDARDYEIR